MNRIFTGILGLIVCTTGGLSAARRPICCAAGAVGMRHCALAVVRPSRCHPRGMGKRREAACLSRRRASENSLRGKRGKTRPRLVRTQSVSAQPFQYNKRRRSRGLLLLLGWIGARHLGHRPPAVQLATASEVHLLRLCILGSQRPKGAPTRGTSTLSASPPHLSHLHSRRTALSGTLPASLALPVFCRAWGHRRLRDS